MKISNLFVLAFFVITSFLSLASADDTSQSPPPSPPPPPLIDTWEQDFLLSNIAMSQWFDGVAEGIDLFLVGKKVSNHPNDTSVNIENSSFSNEGQGIQNTNNINVNLRLPNLEEYWQLKFTSYDDQRDSRGVENNYLRQTPRELKYGATLGFFRKLGSVRTAFQPRIELQNPLKVSHSLSFESVANVGTFEVNPKLELYANASTGAGLFFNFDFHYDINRVYSLTIINEAEYQEKPHFFTVNNGLSIGQLLNSKSALSYSLIFNSNNHPSYHLENYNFSIAWNHLVYKKILDVQLIPHVNFALLDSFAPKAGLTLTLNLHF